MMKIRPAILAAALSAGCFLAQPSAAAPTLEGDYQIEFFADPGLVPASSQCIFFKKLSESKGVTYGSFLFTTQTGTAGFWSQKGDKFTVDALSSGSALTVFAMGGSVLGDGEAAAGSVANWYVNSNNVITYGATAEATLGRSKACNIYDVAPRRGPAAVGPLIDAPRAPSF